jgi:glycosyltransferase involved in cell wall biosynthesis
LLPLAIFLKRCYHARIIYDVHEHLPEMITDFSTRSRPVVAVLVAFFSLLEQRLVRIADAVVVTSAQLARRCRHWNRRVVPIYNYPRRDLFAETSTPLTLQERYRSKRVVLYHGQLGRARAIPILIRAIKQAACRIAEIKLILLGPVFGDGYRAELIGVMKEEDAEELVELLDPVPHPQVPSYLSLCEVGLVVLPDRSVFKHALPIKLLEYMSCGVPVVGSRGLPATEDIVQETRCGLLVEPNDVEALAEAIVFLLSNREAAREMGRRGQRAVKEHYNWERMENRLLAVYHDVMGLIG